MRIAVNARFLLHGQLEGIGTFSNEVLQRVVKQHPEHEFIFFFDRPYHESFVYAENVTPVVLFPPARHPFLFVWWFEFSVAKAIKKHKADLFFSPDGYLSLRSKVPQIPVFHDLAFEHYPDDVPFLAAKHYRYFFPRYANRAKKILTVSEYSKADIQKQYGVVPDKIQVVYNGANEIYQPLNDAKREKVKTKYAQGEEYFLYVGALHQRKNITRLLKAYEQYVIEQKNRNEQPKRLLIVGRKAWGNAEMESTFTQSDLLQKMVSFTGHLQLEELGNIMASAWYHVNVSYFEGFGIPILESMKCEVPVITSQGTSMVEVADDACIKVDPFNVESINKGLMQAHGNSELRNGLIRKAKISSQRFSWEKTANLVSNSMFNYL
ncbi:MAG: glycosyltransferase family 4 protein [Bacteroidia bacterium]